jgi:hypothetical protein
MLTTSLPSVNQLYINVVASMFCLFFFKSTEVVSPCGLAVRVRQVRVVRKLLWLRQWPIREPTCQRNGEDTVQQD